MWVCTKIGHRLGRCDTEMNSPRIQTAGQLENLRGVGKMPEECARDRGHSDVVSWLLSLMGVMGS